MSDCPACAAALIEPHTGFVRADCLGCEIRSVSQAPDWARARYYERIADVEERQAFAEAVRLEFKRRREFTS